MALWEKKSEKKTKQNKRLPETEKTTALSSICFKNENSIKQ